MQYSNVLYTSNMYVLGISTKIPYSSMAHSQRNIMKLFAFTKPHDFRVFTKEYTTDDIEK